MKQFLKQFRYGEKGFILSELLVNVVAVFGVLTAVAVPNVGGFIEQVKTESCDTESQNVMKILADRAAGVLDEAYGCHE